MKVILLRDVAGVGQKGMIKTVSDGYAMNYLIPRKMAEAATAETIKALEKDVSENKGRALQQVSLWNEYAERLKHAHVTLREQANEKGLLYRQIAMEEIAGRLKVELGIDIPAVAMSSSVPIKSLGHSEVIVKLGSHEIKLNVIVEKKTR